MVALKRLRQIDDDDDENGDGPFDKRYPRHMKVIADRGRVRVPMYMTDGMPDWVPRRPMFDASAHRPHQARITASAVRDAAEAAYDAMCARLEDGWLWGKEHVRAPVAVGDSPRDAWIKRQENAWKTPTVRPDLQGRFDQYRTPRPDDDDDDNGLDYTADPGDDDYARSVWAAQNAIAGGRPEAAAQVEATQRRMSMSQPNATAAGVAAERRRYRRHDAEAIADKETAYAEYCRRIQNEWRR
jgi:hypothetical protein